MRGPRMVFADQQGRIYDHPHLGMMGASGGEWVEVDPGECIPLPKGSELFTLPGRVPVGLGPGGRVEVVERVRGVGRVHAVAAFLAPAHTAILWAAWQRLPDAPVLPLFAYAAVGFWKGQFVVPAIRVDPSPRQDPDRFPSPRRLGAAGRRMLRRAGTNRLWQHLVRRCALTYSCPAGRNFVLGRWEAPLPTSRTCNAACLGCISHQPEGLFPVTQPRIDFVPTPEEVAEVACYHLATATEPLVSFGQGCEGEPLTNPGLLVECVRLIRTHHPRATINLNTNASDPAAVEELVRAGLSSIRVSLNSLLPHRHQRYYRPRGWGLAQAIESMRRAKALGAFVSINLLTLPGITDQPEEAKALFALVEEGVVDMIQWRNLNIDPEVYIERVGGGVQGAVLGVPWLIKKLKETFPDLHHGYFNPALEPGLEGWHLGEKRKN